MRPRKLITKDWLLIGGVVAFNILLLVMPPGTSVLDARVTYTVSQANDYLIELGEAGRQQYLLHEYLDLLFIGSYSWLFFRFARRWRPKHERNWRNHIPWYAPALCDYGETLAIIFAIYSQDYRMHLLASAALLTPLKWLALVTTFSCLAAAFRKSRLSNSPQISGSDSWEPLGEQSPEATRLRERGPTP